MIVWHHKVHEHTLGENLAYFQLSFVPVYRRERISAILKQVFQAHHVASYCIYETYGLYDIMIRAWIPLGCGGPRLTSALTDALEDVGCTRVLPFFVSENLHHWLWWEEAEKKLLTPATEDINALDLKLMQRAERDKVPDLIAKLARQQLAREYGNHHGGRLPTDCVKFFTVIPPPMLGVVPARETESMIFRRLRTALVSTSGISEPSMYTGNGFAWILIKGKVNAGSYSKVDEFVQQINELGVEGYYIRTYTYLVTGSAPPFTVEIESALNGRARLEYVAGSAHGAPMVQAERTGSDVIRQLLEHPENAQFEVKSSLKLKVNRYICEEHHPTERDEGLAVDGVLKTIVAFLNTQGGTLLIGALEKPKYEKFINKPGSVLQGLPTVGDWIVCGVNWEYSLVRNLDGFLLSLADSIKDHIGADASALVSFTAMTYQSRDVVLVEVPRGLSSWYYLGGNQFFVRRAGSTISLDGAERERYQMHFKE